jgi:hypothetical protein
MKQENEIQPIEEFMIPKKEKDPLVIDYCDYLNTISRPNGNSKANKRGK